MKRIEKLPDVVQQKKAKPKKLRQSAFSKTRLRELLIEGKLSPVIKDYDINEYDLAGLSDNQQIDLIYNIIHKNKELSVEDKIVESLKAQQGGGGI